MEITRCTLFTVLLIAGCATYKPAPQLPEPPPITGPERPVEVEPAPPAVDAAARECLALTMYWEARGEGRVGMAAVGAIVLNRVADQNFPDTPCDVVYQGGETPPCQFSWWCDGRSDHPTQREIWEACLALADEMLKRQLGDPTHGALFFHSTSITNPWRRTRTAQIGNHVFFR